MLTITHKAHILQRAGFAVPQLSMTFLLSQSERAEALARWESIIDNLFVEYAAARAAKSLRDAEEQRQLYSLQQMAFQPRRERQAAAA